MGRHDAVPIPLAPGRETSTAAAGTGAFAERSVPVLPYERLPAPTFRAQCCCSSRGRPNPEDSTGIQVIIQAARGLEGRGRLVLLDPGDLVRRTLERVQVGRLSNVDIVERDHGGD